MKLASEVSLRQLALVVFLSAMVGAALTYLKGFDSGAWPAWAYFLIGFILTFIVVISLILIYKYNCSKKLEEQEVERI